MTVPNARVILDSISPDGDRLTTMEVTLHRFVLAEITRHRTFSFCAASSRAIPIAKQIDRVMADPAMPLHWGVNKPGMQADETLNDYDIADAKERWLDARNNAVGAVEGLATLGLHKQVASRLLEPFMWTTLIITGTEWQNLWNQRCTRFSPLAQPELRAACDAMLDAYEANIPAECRGWHLPFIDADDYDWAYIAPRNEHRGLDALKKVSAARCARTSYLNHHGVRDPEEDVAMYGRLVSARPMHVSPLEHVARPATLSEMLDGLRNLTGWRQLRQDVEDGARG